MTAIDDEVIQVLHALAAVVVFALLVCVPVGALIWLIRRDLNDRARRRATFNADVDSDEDRDFANASHYWQGKPDDSASGDILCLEAPGRCERCGYDLRATPLRCPECGAGSRVGMSVVRRRLSSDWPTDAVDPRKPEPQETSTTLLTTGDAWLAGKVAEHLVLRGIAATVEPGDSAEHVADASRVRVRIWSGDREIAEAWLDRLFTVNGERVTPA